LAHEATDARGRLPRARRARSRDRRRRGGVMSRILRATAALYRGHLLTYMRSRTAIYWTLAFPLFFLLMFGLAFGRGRPQDFNLLMPGLLTITVISGSLFGVSLRMVTERETGVLRRYRLTPVHPLSIVL